MGLRISGKFALIFLTIINTVFMLFGLGLLIPGILLQANVQLITDEVKPLLDDITISGVSAGDVVNNLSILFIVAGSFIFVVSVMGLIGAFCKSRWLLFAYAMIVLIIFVIQIVGIALWFTMQNEVEQVFTEQMLSLLVSNYQYDSLTSDNQVSNAWNYLFMTFGCCGVNAVASGSSDGGDFALSSWVVNGNRDNDQVIPTSCCTAATTSSYNAPESCTRSVTTGEYYSSGCYDSVRSTILTSAYNKAIIGVGAILLLIEILAVVFALLICHQVKTYGQLA